MGKDQTEPSGELVIKTLAMPMYTNANGCIFGGWVVSQMDLAGAVIAARYSEQRVVTAAIDKMSFISPVNVGDVVCCYGTVLDFGRTSLQVNIQTWAMSSSRNAERRQVTEGVFVFVAIDQDQKPILISRDPI